MAKNQEVEFHCNFKINFKSDVDNLFFTHPNSTQSH